MRLSLTVVMGAALIAAPAIAAPLTGGSPQAGPPPVQYYVDLNSASRNELMTLPGIDAAQAGRIIANRPYLTKTELVTKNVLPAGPFLSLKHLVVAMPATIAKGKH